MSIAKRLENLEARASLTTTPAPELENLSYVELLRLIAVQYSQSPEPLNLNALNDDERGQWESLWQLKPDPATWNDAECFSFGFLHDEAESYQRAMATESPASGNNAA